MENIPQPYFSIIMPIYNVEEYLAEAIESVLQQTFTNYELILVNDCSPDNSKKIIDFYTSSYLFIKSISLSKNGGLSNARNAGLKIAKGRYIYFMDSDDTIEASLFQDVYNSLEINPAQLIVFGLIEEYYDAKNALVNSRSIIPQSLLLSDSLEIHKAILSLEKETLYGYAWNKFYNLAYLKELDLAFENITLIEDIVFNIHYCMNIHSLNVLPIAPYHYKKRGKNSLTSTYISNYFSLNRKRVFLLLKQFKYWAYDNSEVKHVLGNIYIRYIYSALQRNCDKRSKMSYRGKRQWCREMMSDPLLKDLLPYAESSHFIFKVMIKAIKLKNINFILFIGKSIWFVKKINGGLFIRLKNLDLEG